MTSMKRSFLLYARMARPGQLLAGVLVDAWGTVVAAAPFDGMSWQGFLAGLMPLALAWRGWGELDNVFLGGVLLPSYGYAV